MKIKSFISLFLVAGLSASLANAGNRDQAMAVLDSVDGHWPEAEFSAWLNDGQGRSLRVGDLVVFNFESSQPCHANIFYVDSHGVATILAPKFRGVDNRIHTGQPVSYPSPEDGFALQAEPPVGREDFLVACSERPLDLKKLNVAGESAIFEAADVPRVAEQFGGLLADSGRVAISRIESRVVGRGEQMAFTEGDIVSYFTNRSRAIERPKLGLQIHFEHDSTELDDAAKSNLDSFGQALKNERLVRGNFLLGGHTDYTGPDEYNLSLSEQRALAVKEYLATKHDIDAERLSVKGYGESEPLDSNDSEEGRYMNRRVEFQYIQK